MQRICVFCGSSSAVDSEYLEAAAAMGRAIASRGLGLVYGGGGTGLMGALADGALEAGGETIGVTVRMFDTPEIRRSDLTELLVFDTLHERKAKMVELSDGFVALPGGLGTLDELIESLAWVQLGIHSKPVGLLNHKRYFDRFIALLDHVAEQGFLYSGHADLFVSAEQPQDLIDRLRSFQPQVNLAERWTIQTGGSRDTEATS